MSHPYQLLFRTPSMPSAYLSVLLSAIPLGTITLALVLSVQIWTGSLSLAGAITAVFTVGNAIGLTIQGWLVDRFLSRLVLTLAGLLSGVALALVALLGQGLAPVVLAGLVLLAGLSVPAITTAVRRLLPALVVDPATRSAGYAVLSVTFQMAFAIGPLLVSLTLVAVGEAPMALVVAAVMVILATVMFALTVTAPAPAHLGPTGTTRARLTVTRPLIALYAVAALTGTATGMTTVAVPAVTQAAGAAAIAGVVFAAIAVGDVTGAVVFGGRRWPLEERQQLLVALLAAAGVAVAAFFSSATPWLLVLTMGIGGAVGAPVAIRLSSLLDGLVDPEALGLAYAVLASVGLVAAAIGTTAAGQLSAWVDPGRLLLGPPALLLLASLVTVATAGRPVSR